MTDRASNGSSRSKSARTPRVIAIANQKGGVGKSTTAVSLGAALAEIGHRVLVVDLDPQGNASTGLGIKHEAREITVYDILASDAPIEEAVIATLVEGLFAIPSTIDLAGAEIELVSQFSREARLKKAIDPLRSTGEYDFIILDCPPSLGLLTINALTAAQELIVPIQCEYYALEGLGQLLRNVSLVQHNINPDLRVSGIVMTMFDPRTKLSEQVVEEVKRFFGELVYDVIIPRTVRLSEAPGFGQPITVYDPRSKGAESYRELAREVAGRPRPEGPMPAFDDIPAIVMPSADVPGAIVEQPPAEDELEELPTVHELVEQEAVVSSRSIQRAGSATSPAPGGEISPSEFSPTMREEASSVEPAPAAESAPAADEGQRADDSPPPPTGPAPEPPAAPNTDLEDDLWEDADSPRPKDFTGSTDGSLPNVVVIDENEGFKPRSASDEIDATLAAEGKKRRWRLFRKGGE